MNTLLVISNIALWVIVLVLGALILALLRQIGVLYERIAPAGALSMNRKIGVGDSAPEIALENLADAAPLQLFEPAENTAENARESLLFFFGVDCPVCNTLLPVVKSIARAEEQNLRVILASDGERDELREHVQKRGLGHLPCVSSGELGQAYGVAQLPYAVLIGRDRQVRALGLVNSREHLESLLEASERDISSIQEYLQQEYDNEMAG